MDDEERAARFNAVGECLWGWPTDEAVLLLGSLSAVILARMGDANLERWVEFVREARRVRLERVARRAPGSWP